MTSPSVTVAVAGGSGLLVRRPDALLFVPDPVEGTADVVAAFVGAPTDDAAIDAFTTAIVESGFADDPMVACRWSGGIVVVVHGAVEVRSDDPTMPMLSGAGSTSWVERRLATAEVTLTAGEPAVRGTDVGLGSVLAGGFALHVSAAASDTGTPPAGPETTARDPGPVGGGPPAVSDAGTAREPANATEPDGRARAGGQPAHGGRPSPLAALDAATGGDWMEDSLGLPPTGSPPAPPPASPAGAPSPAPRDDRLEPDTRLDEVTLAPEDIPPPPDDGPPPLDDLPSPPDEPRPDRAGAARGDGRGLVRARRCVAGHPNPPDADSCRWCGQAIDPAEPVVDVAQPALGLLRLPSGEEHVVDRPLVVGRRPDPAAAGVEGPSATIVVGDDSAVSRTHLVVRADGWTVTVLDCGSRSGSALIAAPHAEPVALEPWVAYEAPVGAVVHLGGPTSVSVTPAGSADLDADDGPHV